MKVLITGGAGFVAGYLSREFFGQRVLLCDVVGSKKGKVTKLDITDLDDVKRVISKFQPDQIYHLAAIPSPRHGSENLIRKVNVDGTRNVLRACRMFAPRCKIILVSTGYVYGECLKPAKETDKLSPQGVYARSKVQMEKMAIEEFDDLDFVIARPFNHTGKGQQVGFVFPDLVAQISGLTKGGMGTIKTFDLDSERDFSHVKDVVRAYKLLASKGLKHSVYNICSGQATSIREILDMLLEKRSMTGAKISAQKLPHPLKRSVGANRKIKNLGWSPDYSLEDIVEEFSK